MRAAATISALAILALARPSAAQCTAGPVGRWSAPAEISAVALSGSTAAVATDVGLTLLDVIDPAAPVVLAELRGPPVVDVALAGTMAYVVAAGAGLRLLDLSRPAAPVEVGWYQPPEPAACVAIDGPAAYVTTGERLYVVDVSDPRLPAELASIEVQGLRVRAASGHAWVLAEQWGWPVFYRFVTVVDATEPTSPIVVDVLGQVDDVALLGARGVLVHRNAGLRVVEVTDGGDFAEVGRLDVRGLRVAAAAGLALVTSGTEPPGPGLQLVDVSTPDVPFRLGRCELASPDMALAGVPGLVAVAGADDAVEPFRPDHARSSTWVELVAHLAGLAGSDWASDLAVVNPSALPATAEIVLHAASGERALDLDLAGNALVLLEDVAGRLGVDGKAPLELRSPQPVQVVSRVYQRRGDLTFGQAMPGRPASGGLDQGQSGWLLGLRQEAGAFRTNLSVTNTGADPAAVAVTLLATDGSELATLVLDVGPRATEQEVEPSVGRAGRPDLGWGMARLEVVDGSGVLASASVVDCRSNDPTTISMTSP